MMRKETTIAALNALNKLEYFMGNHQLATIAVLLRGEERQHFIDTIIGLAHTIDTMPHTYQQHGMGDEAIAHLHYFHGGCDWFITEKDMGDGSGDRRQLQASGLADMGSPEIGYISIEDLRRRNIDLDLYWTPKTLREIKQSKMLAA